MILKQRRSFYFAISALVFAILSIVGISASIAQADSNEKPKVTIVATGGTIAGEASSRASFTSYRAGSIPMDEMLEYIQPEISEHVDVDVIQFGNSGSGGYTLEEFHELTLVVEDALEEADGVVVTSGTDTMEEFAYWLDLTVQSQKPVVMTGAMRPWSSEGEMVLGADGPANLYNSILLAGSQSTFCFGTVLMLNDEIHAAKDVTKADTYRMDTFESPNNGPLGFIDGTNISTDRAPARVQSCGDLDEWMTPFDMTEVEADDLARTEIVYTYQNAGGEAITAFAEAGVDGIVTAGTGAGGISSAQRAAQNDAIENHDVVFATSSRTGAGNVYGGRDQIIAANDLIPQKARILLTLGLTYAPDNTEQVAEWFHTIGNPQFNASNVDNDDEYPTWQNNAIYVAGDRVWYDDVLYEAKWWTVNEIPSESGEWDVWKVVESEVTAS
ncbi:hypothetical protein DH09_19835 [Bacillaceae bacterium JMAK1]|nr:hypothetical protein DH09_19835 [Bacillaceae bacterium JMAK1]